MTSPPSPPNRRRRRIVVAIAVLVLGLGWWFWPRLDQRFVGKWAFDKPVLGQPRLILRSNGGGSDVPHDAHAILFSWKVKDGELVTGRELRPWTHRIVALLNEHVGMRLGVTVQDFEQHWKIVDIRDGYLSLEPPSGSWGALKLRRLPE